MLKQAVFLVGGRGGRLDQMSETTPKSCLAVGGRPFIRYLMDTAVRHGLTDIVLLADDRTYAFDALCGNGSDFAAMLRDEGVEIRIVKEPEASGTAGALARARDILDDVFLLANGDSFFDFNWLDLLTLPAADDWQVRAALRKTEDGARYGAVDVDGALITAFHREGKAGPGTVDGGVYIVRRSTLDDIRHLPMSLEHDVLPALAGKRRLYGRRYGGFFLDIGVADDLARAGDAVARVWRKPAVFLDRDGVLNIDHGYVHRPDQVDWIPGAKATVKRFNDKGFLVFVISNQSGVARGLFSEQDVQALHRWMAAELQRVGAHVDRFEYCPFHPEGVVERYRRISTRRKPGPGMLVDCMARWPVDKSKSFLIGDKSIDVEAAGAAGIPGYIFTGPDLLAFVEMLCAKNSGAGTWVDTSAGV